MYENVKRTCGACKIVYLSLKLILFRRSLSRLLCPCVRSVIYFRGRGSLAYVISAYPFPNTLRISQGEGVRCIHTILQRSFDWKGILQLLPNLEGRVRLWSSRSKTCRRRLENRQIQAHDAQLGIWSPNTLKSSVQNISPILGGLRLRSRQFVGRVSCNVLRFESSKGHLFSS